MRRLTFLSALSLAPLALASSEPPTETPPASEPPPAAESREQPAARAPRLMFTTSLLPYTTSLMANLEVEAVVLEHLAVYSGGYYSPLAGFGGQLGLRAYLGRALSGFYTDVYGSYFRFREITPGGGVGAGYTLALGDSIWRASAGAALEVSFPNPSTTRLQPVWRLQIGFAL